MTADPHKPFRLLNIDRRVEELFSELIHQPWGRLPPDFGSFAVDVHETDEAYLIEADLPGVSPEDLQLTIEERRLTLRGLRRSVEWQKTGRSLRMERAQGEFLRVLDFDLPIDLERVEKQFEHGLLRIRLAKSRHR